jgi:hypothetical protein
VVQNWKKLPTLLSLECVLDSANINNLIQLITKALIINGVLSKKYMTKKLVSFGVDRVVVFQGIHSGVIVQIQEKYAPRMLGVH